MLTPAEVAERGFERTRIGGYNPSEVDTFLDSVTADYTALYKDCATLKSKMKTLVEKIEEYRTTEDDMRTTLLMARRRGEEIIAEAEQQKAEMLKQAGEYHDHLMVEADEEVADYRAQLQQELRDYEKKLAAARTSTVNFVTAMRTIVEAQSSFLERIPTISEQNPNGDPEQIPPQEPVEETPVEEEVPVAAAVGAEFTPAEQGEEYQV